MLTNVAAMSIISLAVDEAWLSLVERCVRDAEAAGSNPVASTKCLFLEGSKDLEPSISLQKSGYRWLQKYQ